MASKLTTLQTQRYQLAEEAKALRSQARILASDDTPFDAEKIAALKAQIEAKDAEIAAKDQEIKAVQDLLALEAQAPAAVTYSNPLQATPQVEKDPKWGFASIGHYAQGVYTLQHCNRQGIPVPSRLAEQFQFVDAITSKFLQQEAQELRAHGFSAAADTPFHQESYSEDGRMVPPEFRQEIWKPAYEADDLLQFFAPETSSSSVIDFLADESTPWGASGIIAYWVAEGAQLTASKLTTQPRSVRMQKVGVFVSTTNELLQDAPLLSSRLNEKAPLALGWQIAEGWIRGNGIGKPLGYEAAANAGRIEVPKETSQKAGTIYAENVSNMSARIAEGPGSRLLWLCHRSCIPRLISLKIGNEPSWVAQNQGLQGAPNGMLLAVPIKFSQHATVAGTVGDISLIDFSGYAAFVHSSGTRFDASLHLYFDFDKYALRWIARVAGMPLLSTPIIPRSGGADNSLSHFVQLATRA